MTEVIRLYKLSEKILKKHRKLAYYYTREGQIDYKIRENAYLELIKEYKGEKKIKSLCG